MALRVYATPTDYAAHADEPFDGDDAKLLKRLRAASLEVESLTTRSIFATDADGYPTDVDEAEAFTEATCAIVEHWEITGDPTGAEAGQGAVKIGSVSLGTTSSAQSADEATTGRIGSRAITALTNAGLRTSTVWHR